MIKLNKLKFLLLAGLFTLSLLVPVSRQKDALAANGADFSAGNIIDDATFWNKNAMSVQEIQSFLNSKVPSCDTWGQKMYGNQTRAQYGASIGNPAPFICLRDYIENPDTKANNLRGESVTGGRSAAQLIYDVSQSTGVSAKVILVMLQKEQGLITDDWPFLRQYRSAVGYGCPDTAACDSQYYGFYNQIYNGANIFNRYKNNPGSYRYKAGQNNQILWNPNSSCGTSTVSIENQATAGLYIYTPYRPNQAALNNMYGTGDGCSAYGNRNFWRYYTDWFGSTKYVNPVIDFKGAICNNPSTPFFSLRAGKVQIASSGYWLTFENNTGSGCIEFHRWEPSGNFSIWSHHLSTNHPAIDPANGEVVFADRNGDGKDEANLILYKNTGSGKIEVHTWSQDFSDWTYHGATNHPAIDPANGEVVFADRNGDGKDEANLILYKNTGSGKIEVHTWSQDFSDWTYHGATNHPAIDPANGEVVFADRNGDGKDEANLILYKNTGSGKIEVHTWSQDFSDWTYHGATNHPAIDPANGEVVFADRNGDGKDEANLILYKNTGSGKIEVHTWSQDFSDWTYHGATNHPAI